MSQFDQSVVVPSDSVFYMGGDRVLRWVAPNDEETTREAWHALLVTNDSKARTPGSGFIDLNRVVALVEDDEHRVGSAWMLLDGGYAFRFPPATRDNLEDALSRANWRKS